VNAKPIGRGVNLRHVVGGKDTNFASMLYEISSADGTCVRWVHEIMSRLEAHQRFLQNRRDGHSLSDEIITPAPSPGTVLLKARELVLLPRTREEILTMDTPPFSLKPGERLSFIRAIRKNDMVELDLGEQKCIYRVQKMSQDEIQLCEHFQHAIEGKDRNTTNRITATDTLRRRGCRFVRISPDGQLRYE
jgi:CRISPR-associated endonuclease Csn1